MPVTLKHNHRILLLSLLVIFILSCETKRREVYEIPAGYRGWVEIRAERVGCPPLPVAQGATIVVVPQTGLICTSSSFPDGLGYEDYYYVNRDGERVLLRSSAADSQRMIWGVEYYGSSGPGGDIDDQHRKRFYVGTRADYEGQREKVRPPSA